MNVALEQQRRRTAQQSRYEFTFVALMERDPCRGVISDPRAARSVRLLAFCCLAATQVRPIFFIASAEDTLSSAIEHIRLAQDNRILVIAHATADLMAKFAHGLADDLLTTMYLAFTGKVVLAPAMNTNMWEHPATRENLRILRERGHIIVEPEDGLLACGMVGPGRPAEPERIAEAVVRASGNEAGGDFASAGNLMTPRDSRFGRRSRPRTHRGSHTGAARRFAIYDQSVKWKDGLRAGRGSPARGAHVKLVSGPVNLLRAARRSTRARSHRK